MKYILLFFLFSFFSCSKVDDAKDNAINKVKSKVSKTSEVVWRNGVEKLFQNSTTINSVKLDDIYTKGLDFEYSNQKGVKIDFLGGFYQCFFKYQSDQNDLFKFLIDLETDKVDISDKEIKRTNEDLIIEKLNFIKIKFPNIYNQLNFFTDFSKKENLEYYTIAKYPYFNILIYDESNNIFYHFVENYHD